MILADEPTGNLDPKTSQDVFELFARLQAERGVAFVIATHNLDLARRADRLVRLVEDARSSRPDAHPAIHGASSGATGLNTGRMVEKFREALRPCIMSPGVGERTFRPRTRGASPWPPGARTPGLESHVFERFERARRVIILAREEAGRFRHDFVGNRAHPARPDPRRGGEFASPRSSSAWGCGSRPSKSEVERPWPDSPRPSRSARSRSPRRPSA